MKTIPNKHELGCSIVYYSAVPFSELIFCHSSGDRYVGEGARERERERGREGVGERAQTFPQSLCKLSLSALEAGLLAAAWSEREGDGERLQCSTTANFQPTILRSQIFFSKITMYSPYCLTQVNVCLSLLYCLHFSPLEDSCYNVVVVPCGLSITVFRTFLAIRSFLKVFCFLFSTSLPFL